MLGIITLELDGDYIKGLMLHEEKEILTAQPHLREWRLLTFFDRMPLL